jgi:hypothetical protein
MFWNAKWYVTEESEGTPLRLFSFLCIYKRDMYLKCTTNCRILRTWEYLVEHCCVVPSSGEYPCQDCWWISVRKILWRMTSESIRLKTTECTSTHYTSHIDVYSTSSNHMHFCREYDHSLTNWYNTRFTGSLLEVPDVFGLCIVEEPVACTSSSLIVPL